MTTTTTVTAPNSGLDSILAEPSATDTAHRAGTGQREGEHADPAANGSAPADPAATGSAPADPAEDRARHRATQPREAAT